MSTVIILTPIIISSWPVIAAAAGAAAASLGLIAQSTVSEAAKNSALLEVENSVEVDVSESTTVAQNMKENQKLEFTTQEGLKITIGRDARGKCTVCASGKGFSKAELKQKSEEFVEKFTQCYVYNKVVTELKAKKFQIVDQKVEDDQSIRVNVRRWTD